KSAVTNRPIVQKCKRLRSHRSLVATFTRSVTVGAVEDLEQWVAQRANAKCIDRPGISLFRRGRGVICRGGRAHNVRWLQSDFPVDFGKYARATHSRVQFPRH